MGWKPPEALDKACKSLCIALNRLPGVETTESCCGHGDNPYRIWMDVDWQSVGGITLARCSSGRYYNYAPGELRLDPEWGVHLYHGDVHPIAFVLLGKVMEDGNGLHPPAEKLAANLQKHIDDNFRLARWFIEDHCETYFGDFK